MICSFVISWPTDFPEIFCCSAEGYSIRSTLCSKILHVASTLLSLSTYLRIFTIKSFCVISLHPKALGFAQSTPLLLRKWNKGSLMCCNTTSKLLSCWKTELSLKFDQFWWASNNITRGNTHLTGYCECRRTSSFVYKAYSNKKRSKRHYVVLKSKRTLLENMTLKRRFCQHSLRPLACFVPESFS